MNNKMPILLHIFLTVIPSVAVSCGIVSIVLTNLSLASYSYLEIGFSDVFYWCEDIMLGYIENSLAKIYVTTIFIIMITFSLLLIVLLIISLKKKNYGAFFIVVASLVGLYGGLIAWQYFLYCDYNGAQSPTMIPIDVDYCLMYIGIIGLGFSIASSIISIPVLFNKKPNKFEPIITYKF